MIDESARVEAGIAAYADQQAEIKKVILSHGNSLHQRDFDLEFRHRRMPITPLPDETFILGGLCFGPWAKWLDLTQIMVSQGILEQTGRIPNISYHVSEDVSP